MSETPTDRVELTEDERERIIDEFTEGRNPWDFVAVVESIVAARVQAYAEKFESLSDRAKKAATELGRKNDRLAAELAAANARCGELEAELRVAEHRLGSIAKDLGMDEPDTPVAPITRHDPRWQELRKHVGVNIMATLDRVTALADEWDFIASHGGSFTPDYRIPELRAALTPEGTE